MAKKNAATLPLDIKPCSTVAFPKDTADLATIPVVSA